jgi:hypothetical protein
MSTNGAQFARPYVLAALQAPWVTVRLFRLDELRETFLAKLDWEKCQTSPPFDKLGKDWFERCAKL